MSKGVWIIIFSIILVGMLVVIAAVVYMNFIHGRTSVPIDLEQMRASGPEDAGFTDEQIVRLEVQLTNSDPDERFIAICSLNAAAQDNPERIGPILVKALANEDPKVRFMAATQLGEIKYAAAARPLANLLDDEDEDVRAGASQALVKLGEPGLKAVMESLAGDRMNNVDGALIVAKKITGRSFGQGQQGRAEALKFWAEYNSQR